MTAMERSRPGEWIDEAACKRDWGTHFPTTEHKRAGRPKADGTAFEQRDRALANCARCPVQRECLEYAVRNGERFGIWGGLTFPLRSWQRKGLGLGGSE